MKNIPNPLVKMSTSWPNEAMCGILTSLLRTLSCMYL